MNKEAKIGLTIILVLMIAFVAVLAKRLYSPYAGSQTLAVEDKSEEKIKALANTEKVTSNKVDKAKTTIAPAGRPTVVAANTIADKPPQGTASDEDQWSTASDSGKVEISAGSALDLKSPPSYMPDPPKAGLTDRFADYKTSAAADSTDNRDASRYDQTSLPAAAGRTYTVAEGDSLFDIARCELGKASRWVEIYDLNTDLLGKEIDCLVPGTQIVLPDDNIRTADPLTRHSNTEYRK